MGNEDKDYTFTLDGKYDITFNGDSDGDVKCDVKYTTSPIDVSSLSSLVDTDDSNITLNLDSSTWESGDVQYTITNNVDFVDSMPSLWKIKDMCKHYPALEKAFENFKTVYAMVQQDYKGNHEDDEEIPF